MCVALFLKQPTCLHTVMLKNILFPALCTESSSLMLDIACQWGTRNGTLTLNSKPCRPVFSEQFPLLSPGSATSCSLASQVWKMKSCSSNVGQKVKGKWRAEQKNQEMDILRGVKWKHTLQTAETGTLQKERQVIEVCENRHIPNSHQSFIGHHMPGPQLKF